MTRISRLATFFLGAAVIAGAGILYAAFADATVAPAQSAATQPASTQPAPGPPMASRLGTSTGDWPGFHGGGSLRGEAKALPAQALALRWTFKPAEDAGPIEGGAAIAGGTVYVGDMKGRLYALELATGKQKWVYAGEDGFATTPLVIDGKVMLGDLSSTFHCVSAADGKKLWTFDTETAVHASANAAGEGADLRILFGTDGADIFCLDAGGKKVWSVKAGDRINSAPGIGWGQAFISGCDGKLRGLDLRTGQQQCEADLGSVGPGSPAVLDDRIIMGVDGGRVVCFSKDGKQKLWEYSDVKDESMVYASPAVADGVVVVGARDRNVHAIDVATGKKLWNFATRGDVDSSPAISGGRVFIGSRDKKLYTLDLKTGESLGEFTTGRAIVASPAVAAGVVVVGDTAGNVYCLEPR